MKNDDTALDNIKKKLESIIHKNYLPNDVIISTMTVICSIPNIKFECQNIVKYIDLDNKTITNAIGVINGVKTNRSYLGKSPKIKSNKEVKTTFLNQISLLILSDKKESGKPINMKIFSNGSIQMTGCKSICDVVDVLHKLITKLKIVKTKLDVKNRCMIEIPFVSDRSLLSIDKIKDIKIVMINSNFSVPFRINREKLYNIARNDDFICVYDSVKHAAVKIKYNCPSNKSTFVSILIFGKGSIIITGANNCIQIKEGYDFIHKYLLLNIYKIMKVDLKHIINANNVHNAHNINNEHNEQDNTPDNTNDNMCNKKYLKLNKQSIKQSIKQPFKKNLLLDMITK